MFESQPAVGASVETSVRHAYAARPGFGEWKAKIDAIASEEGLTPKDNPLPGELDVWIKHFNDGKTPAQAWKAVPYRKPW